VDDYSFTINGAGKNGLLAASVGISADDGQPWSSVNPFPNQLWPYVVSDGTPDQQTGHAGQDSNSLGFIATDSWISFDNGSGGATSVSANSPLPADNTSWGGQALDAAQDLNFAAENSIGTPGGNLYGQVVGSILFGKAFNDNLFAPFVDLDDIISASTPMDGMKVLAVNAAIRTNGANVGSTNPLPSAAMGVDATGVTHTATVVDDGAGGWAFEVKVVTP
jgi:hypothetical protein